MQNDRARATAIARVNGVESPPYWSYTPKGAERPARRKSAAPEPEKESRFPEQVFVFKARTARL
jgi:hypothetical protein